MRLPAVLQPPVAPGSKGAGPTSRAGMSRKPLRVAQLAQDAETDLDEALVTLWDAGIEYVEGATSVVRSRDVAQARRALGLTDAREQGTVDYWLRVSGLTRHELGVRLAEVGVTLPEETRRIPKGSLRRLRSMFDERSHAATSVDQTTSPALRPISDFKWETVGRPAAIEYISEQQVLAVHRALEEDARFSGDPISPPGVKDEALLSSAVHRPQTSLGSHRKYESVEMAAAALFHSIVLNHAFHNGNKRTGLVSLIAFLDAHKIVLTCSRAELFKMTLRVASHGLVPASADNLADREVLAIAHWIKSNSRTVDRHERPMQWLKLRKRLRELGCECTPAQGVGNRMNITRTVEERTTVLRRTKRRVLTTQVACAGDGTDAAKNTIHKIRADLHLDDEHGYDSAAFYDDAVVDSFIAEYRDILKRLSKL